MPIGLWIFVRIRASSCFCVTTIVLESGPPTMVSVVERSNLVVFAETLIPTLALPSPEFWVTVHQSVVPAMVHSVFDAIENIVSDCTSGTVSVDIETDNLGSGLQQTSDIIATVRRVRRLIVVFI